MLHGQKTARHIAEAGILVLRGGSREHTRPTRPSGMHTPTARPRARAIPRAARSLLSRGATDFARSESPLPWGLQCCRMAARGTRRTDSAAACDARFRERSARKYIRQQPLRNTASRCSFRTAVPMARSGWRTCQTCAPGWIASSCGVVYPSSYLSSIKSMECLLTVGLW